MTSTIWPVEVTLINSVEDLPQVLAADRAVAFMTVDWSVPERKGRWRFREFVQQWSRAGSPSIDFFAINEDVDELRMRFPRTIGCACVPLGAGSLHWMERGTVVAGEVCASSVSVDRLVEKSAALWGAVAAWRGTR